jgi:hypothetical protein
LSPHKRKFVVVGLLFRHARQETTIICPIVAHSPSSLSLTIIYYQGKVHNPSGEGVRAVSTNVQSKAAKVRDAHTKAAAAEDSHETKVKEEGSARRNITHRKKSDNTYDSRNKKQGGHGKGQWSELQNNSSQHHDEDLLLPLDKKDPLYDEEELDSGKYILASGDPTKGATGEYDDIAEKAIYGNMLTLPEFKIQITQAMKEYFDSSDADEVIREIEEMKCPSFHPEVVKKAISLSLDKGPRERELVSRLLTCLHPTPLSEKDVEAGFDLLLRSLDDLSIDIPDAKVCIRCAYACAPLE